MILQKNREKVELSIWDVKTKNEFKKCICPEIIFTSVWDGYMTPCCAKTIPKN